MSNDDINARLYGLDLFGEPMAPAPAGPVNERFGFPPFSVLDARSGEWQDRKRSWTSIGIKSEVGRDAASIHCPTTATNNAPLEDANFTSIFDPTLCECIYRWFTGDDSLIVDPFAGGSVRGIVAGMLGRRYWGCDLRQEQIDANEVQADDIAPAKRPTWVCGDALQVLDQAPAADFIFSCPPYGNLEKYSDDPTDLSAMDDNAFDAAYRAIIAKAVARLRPDRFACFVVGDYRDRRGFYRNFVSLTIDAFQNAGAALYNEAILVTSVGSASMRVTKQFSSGRKFAKTHQNVLVFCKGDWRRAAAHCGNI